MTPRICAATGFPIGCSHLSTTSWTTVVMPGTTDRLAIDHHVDRPPVKPNFFGVGVYQSIPCSTILRMITSGIIQKINRVDEPRSQSAFAIPPLWCRFAFAPSLKPGNRVIFQPPGQRPLEGMLTRYNKKAATVITDDGGRWNVSPNHLKKVTLPATNLDTSYVVLLCKACKYAGLYDMTAPVAISVKSELAILLPPIKQSRNQEHYRQAKCHHI